jgi:hypothetical protein
MPHAYAGEARHARAQAHVSVPACAARKHLAHLCLSQAPHAYAVTDADACVVASALRTRASRKRRNAWLRHACACGCHRIRMHMQRFAHSCLSQAPQPRMRLRLSPHTHAAYVTAAYVTAYACGKYRPSQQRMRMRLRLSSRMHAAYVTACMRQVPA